MTTPVPAGSERALGLEFLRGPASAAPPPAIPLQAGPLTAQLQGIDLAHVASGDAAVLRLLHVAVRDELWNTIPPQTAGLRVEQRADSFAVSFTARHVSAALDFAWSGQIEGHADGALTYEMTGTAARAFRYGRIGLCALQLAELYGGCRYRAVTESGVSEGVLSHAIVPQPLVDGVYVPAAGPFSALEVDLPSGVTAAFAFEGDQFELEDQRNWTDAAFKTYSTPLSLGLTHEASSGTVLRQRVTVRCRAGGPSAPRAGGTASARRVPARAAVELLEPTGAECPAIGAVCRELPDSPTALNAVRNLRLDHHRIDIDLTEQSAPERSLDERMCPAGARSAVELALTLSAETVGRAAGVLSAVQRSASLARVLVFDAAAEVSPAALVAAVKEAARASAPGVPIAGGTDLWFAELNRNAPADGLDAVSFSITPQFHLGDDESLFETLPIQALAVAAAGTLYPGLPVVVSPVTLHVRDVFQIRSGEPEPTDSRQPSLLCAAWTAGSLAHLSATCASALTYFELLGPRGLIPGAHGDGAAGDAPVVVPAYHVLRDACERTGGAVVATDSSDPGRLAATASDVGGRRELSVANLTPEPRRVTVGPFGRHTRVTLRSLDSSTLGAAMFRPEEFRSAAHPAAVERGAIELDLHPYAVCTLRCERE